MSERIIKKKKIINDINGTNKNGSNSVHLLKLITANF